MEITIEDKPSLLLAGILLENVSNKDCPAAWEQLFQNYNVQALEELGNGQAYGVCLNLRRQGGINYLAGYQVHDRAKAEELGLTVMEVTSAKYAILPISGPVPDSIRQGFQKAWQEFFPRSIYRHAEGPDLEVYSKQNLSVPNFQMELWFSVTK